ncbi:MAG: hypothetical protein ABFQ62_02645 [Patescibacteria group bacterium]
MTNKKINDPFKDLVLDEEEQVIEDALNRGEYVSNPNLAETKKMLEEAARNYLELNKSKPVTIRVNQLDLIKVKAKAKRKNIPYQTLLGSLIRQYATGEYTLNI